MTRVRYKYDTQMNCPYILAPELTKKEESHKYYIKLPLLWGLKAVIDNTVFTQFSFAKLFS